MRQIGFLFCSLIIGLITPGLSFGEDNLPAGKPYVYKQVGGKALTLWITEPADVGSTDASPSRAAVVLFHGGGWTAGRPGQMSPQSSAIAQHGGVGVTVEYRLMADHSKEPRICIEDTKSAMRWIRVHATMLKIDPNRIAIGGASAGGYNAAYATMVPGWDAPDDDMSISPRGNAMVLWNPVIDTSEDGYSHETFGDDAVQRSPMTYLNSKTPPMLIQSGTEDVLIHANVLRAFADKTHTLGVHCELLTYDGQRHGFFNKEPFLSQTNNAMVRFLASLGYIRS